MADNKKFVFEIDLTPEESKIFDFENITQKDSLNQQTQKYAPLKNIQIPNTSSSTLNLYINGERGYTLIPAGSILTLENKNIYRLEIKNASTTNDANIIFTLDNEPTTKELTEKLLKQIQKVL